MLAARLKKVLANFFLLNRLILKEVNSAHRIRFRDKLKAWRHGFLSESFILYNLGKTDYRNYLSDLHRFIRTPYVNNEYALVLNNKFIFYSVLIGFKEYLPKIYFLINNGEIMCQNNSLANNNIQDIESLFAEKVDFVIKPFYGGGGKGIYIVKNRNNCILLNGNEVQASDIIRMCNKLNKHMLTEYIGQANYSRTIFERSVNTIRILTMWDINNSKPFIAAAVHRFGTKRSSPVDNWTQGGLSAFINIENGELGRATCLPQDRELKWFDRHPDTSCPISGVKIPRWEQVKSKLLSIAHSFPMIPYIGWDIVVQDEAFKIIEANNHSDVNLLQVHRPLLLDKRVIEFYRRYNVIK